MRQILYIPFPAPAMADSAVRAIGQSPAPPDICVTISTGAQRPLRDVPPEDLVIVFGHACPERDRLCDGAGAQLALPDLAFRMLADGLSLQHRRCALLRAPGPAAPVQPTDELAAHLSRALAHLGYRNTRVTAHAVAHALGAARRACP